MILKEFDTKQSPWGFKVFFADHYEIGQRRIEELLGDRKAPSGHYRWYLMQDMPWSMAKGRKQDLINGWSVDGHRRRKGRIYVFDSDIAVMLKLMSQ